MAEPKFIPKPGQVDYTNIRYVPVINIIVAHGGKILLVQRDAGMRLYPGYWNGISGFLDDSQDIVAKVHEELREELGLIARHVTDVKQAPMFMQDAPEYHKTWLVVPVLAAVDNNEFQLNWEAQRAQWFTPAQAKQQRLLPGCETVLGRFFK